VSATPVGTPFDKVLVANRGEIAARILATLHRLGIASVAVTSEPDRTSLPVIAATESVLLGPGPAAQSYLRVDAVLAAAVATGAGAVHPGYGFLSENAGFAAAVEEAGIAFLGPTPAQISLFGDKHTAREAARDAGVPLLEGTGLLGTVDEAVAAAETIGYPVMLKSAAGGGGIGMAVCRSADELVDAYARVRRTAASSFGADAVYLERFVAQARHVEVQVFGDGNGAVAVLGDRDCSAQRRNQKVVEETPAPALSDALRTTLWDSARDLCASVSYRSAGTVEFVVDAARGDASFLEVNTRLQVEHPVTEMTCGVDLVEWMVRLGAGDTSFVASYEHRPQGHAIEVRLYAEDPVLDFRPSAGVLTEVAFPDTVEVEGATVRTDTWVDAGTEVTPFYDPLLAKVVVHAPDRAAAVDALAGALDATRLSGIETNLAFLRDVVRTPELVEGTVRTATLAGIDHCPATVEVLDGGGLTTVQDHPGRLGYWAVGVPPSGPMDALSFRLGNRIVGNDEGAPGLELTVRGPTLRFDVDTTICLTGAHMPAQLDGDPVPWWEPVSVPAGATLAMAELEGAGCRTYLLVRGGFDVPAYLGSASTFTLGGFGGHGGRALRGGDVLHLRGEAAAVGPIGLPGDGVVPTLADEWEIGVLPGPHAAPDYFLPDDIGVLYGTDWEVHYNSARTGVRLVGPRPRWARPDGGEAGLHPSNINDTPYAVGAIDFTGDMPILLGPDGPSLGGFVCPATTVAADLWKLGQLAPGDTVRFVPLTAAQAARAEAVQDEMVRWLARPEVGAGASARFLVAVGSSVVGSGVLLHRRADGDRPSVTYRQSGDRNLLVEYGPDVLDLDLRLRVHALMEWVEAQGFDGVIDVTPGIRSLQVHVDSRRVAVGDLLDAVVEAEAELPPPDDMVVPSRIVHLPLSWDDPSTIEATQRYMATVRPDAPWCPHNLEFIRRANGLASIDDVHDIVYGASYVVLGLGDVYLGAPVATPLDPRHRLVTTKYNPARTWTPENAVGIGGSYLCIYGMEGPGGYQFVGRTVPVWNTWRSTHDFVEGTPWLLRFFDQIRWYPVGAEELLDLRRDLRTGRHRLTIEETTLSRHEHRAFLEANADSIGEFRERQQEAFSAERAAWAAAGEFDRVDAAPAAAPADDAEVVVPDGGRLVTAALGASVWQVEVAVGQVVAEGDTLVVLESMKMETAVVSPAAGEVVAIACSPGEVVSAGTPLVVLGPAHGTTEEPAA
jgi:urea carboxylase